MNGMKNYVILLMTAALPLALPLVAADVPAPKTPAATAPPAAGQGFLGIQLDEVDEALSYHLGLANDLGVVVAGISPGGAGEVMGLKQFDVVVAADEAPIYTPRALGDLVKAKHAGDILRLTVRRGAESVVLSGKLAARPAEMPGSEGRRLHRFGSPNGPLSGAQPGPITGANGQRRGTMLQPDGSTMEWSIDESPEPPASAPPLITP
jgi:hypothetical protein